MPFITHFPEYWGDRRDPAPGESGEFGRRTELHTKGDPAEGRDSYLVQESLSSTLHQAVWVAPLLCQSPLLSISFSGVKLMLHFLIQWFILFIFEFFCIWNLCLLNSELPEWLPFLSLPSFPPFLPPSLPSFPPFFAGVFNKRRTTLLIQSSKTRLEGRRGGKEY